MRWTGPEVPCDEYTVGVISVRGGSVSVAAVRMRRGQGRMGEVIAVLDVEERTLDRVPLRQTPRAVDVLLAIDACLRTLVGRGFVHPEHYLLILPAWVCAGSRQVNLEIPVWRWWSWFVEGPHPVPERDVLRLQRMACVLAVPLRPEVEGPRAGAEGGVSEDAGAAGSERVSSVWLRSRNVAVLELIPQEYVIDGMRAVKDPVSEPAERLRLEARVVVAQRLLVQDLLRGLHQMNIRIGGMLSVYSVAGGLLSASDQETDAAVIDVDHRHLTWCYYRGGSLRHTEAFPFGIDHALASVADRGGPDRREMDRDLRALTDRIYDAHPEGDDWGPLFDRQPPQSQPASRLTRAAEACADELLEAVKRCVRASEREAGGRLRSVILTGDHPLVLHILEHSLRDRLGVKCRWQRPRRMSAERVEPCALRPLIRQCVSGDFNRPRQEYLRQFHRSRVGRSLDAAAAKLESAGDRRISRFRELRDRRVPTGAEGDTLF